MATMYCTGCIHCIVAMSPSDFLTNNAVFTSKYNSKIRGALKDTESQADLVHETTSGA